MRISDWSSDVCSSDLGVAVDDGTIAVGIVVVAAEGDGGRAGDAADMDVEAGLGGLRLAGDVAFRIDLGGGRRDMHREVVAVVDRQLHADEFGEVDAVTGRLAAVEGDRKSTRLNSSH